MRWEMERFGRGDVTQQLPRVFFSGELQAARESIQRFGRSGHADTVTTADKLLKELAEEPPRIAWETLVSLSRWCHTDGPYKTGRSGAEDVSRALFGEVLPNLGRDASGKRLVSHQARLLAANFFERKSRDAEQAAYEHNLSAFPPAALPPAGLRGSDYCLEYYVRAQPKELEHRLLGSTLSLDLSTTGIEWEVGPADLASGAVSTPSELDDAEFRQFWPTTVPDWQARGCVLNTGTEGMVLVRSRSYPAERPHLLTDRSATTRTQVAAAFARTQGFMGSVPTDWTVPGLYELGVDLATLYYLNEVAEVRTWLALIYFSNDPTSQATSLDQWRQHHRDRLRALGLHAGCRLLGQIIPLFLEAPAAGALMVAGI